MNAGLFRRTLAPETAMTRSCGGRRVDTSSYACPASQAVDLTVGGRSGGASDDRDSRLIASNALRQIGDPEATQALEDMVAEMEALQPEAVLRMVDGTRMEVRIVFGGTAYVEGAARSLTEPGDPLVALD